MRNHIYTLVRNYVRSHDWLRVRWNMVRFFFMIMSIRVGRGLRLKKIGEFDPVFNSDEFGLRTMLPWTRKLYRDWLMELREYRHILDFPEKWVNESPKYKTARQIRKELDGYNPIEALEVAFDTVMARDAKQ